MEIDNFNAIAPLLEFPKKEDSFYFLQIIQRKKENPELGNNSRVIKSYYVNSIEKYVKLKDEIVKQCKAFNARAGINLNVRSFEKTSYRLLRKVADQMHNGDFYSVRTAYDSVCGEYQAENDKRWILDVDSYDDIANLQNIIKYVEREQAKVTNKPYKILTTLPTKNGFHVITNPFNLEYWDEVYPTVMVHKNNPTLLYYDNTQTE